MTAFTGHPVGDHGWYSYWDVHPADYQPRVLSSADERQPFLWNRPEFHSKRFIVINICGTHPPKPVNGCLISYPMQQTLRATYPRDLQLSLSSKGIRLIHDVSVWYSGQERGSFLSRVLRADEARIAAALSCWQQEPKPDVMILNLTAIDRVSHFYWHEIEPGSPIPESEGAIFQAYANSDRALSQLMELVDTETSLLVFSEIGFGPLRAYYAVNDTLAANGFLTWENSREVSGVRWRDTIAFEAVQGSHGVNINVEGRYKEGKIQQEDYIRVRDEVIDALQSFINPHTGLKFFQRVLPKEEIYSGRVAEEAADIILDPADERYQPLGDPFWANHVNRRLQSGWHRRDSFWAGFGPAFNTGGEDREATPLDIAPTICQMLDIVPPADWCGRALGVG
jgi:predicted AlkP superfamily phosphohydrolase/phosphomutase